MSKKMRSMRRQKQREVEQQRRKRGESTQHVPDDNSAIENALMDVAHMMKVSGLGVTSWAENGEVFLLVQTSQYQPDMTVAELIKESKQNSQDSQQPEGVPETETSGEVVNVGGGELEPPPNP